MSTGIPYKIFLEENEMPRHWINLPAFMGDSLDPMLVPGSLKQAGVEDLLPVFCAELAEQELNKSDKYIEIPEIVRNFYMMYRPSPVVRAYNLEKALDTPAEIYYKFEGTNTSGSHKLNSAVAQVYYAMEQGITHVTTETGAGQWGTALSMACGFFGLQLTVFMVRSSAQQKPYRKAVMETYGAKVIPSPSLETEAGRRILQEYPDTSGSLGCAISEAIEVAAQDKNSRYVLGSVLNQVILHQSIIGIETKAALEKYDIVPDVIIGCAGGGSNLGGLIAPYVADKLQGKNNIDIVAVEPASCPSMTRGVFAYDHADTGKMTPLIRMYTLGNGFIPPSNHSGGLRFHGMSPIVSRLYHDGHMRAVSVPQTKVFEAASIFCRAEGTLPAPESNHAVWAAMDEALRCRESGEKKKILFGLTGTGYFDLSAYAQFNEGTMTDYIPTDEDLQKGFASLPDVPVK